MIAISLRPTVGWLMRIGLELHNEVSIDPAAAASDVDAAGICSDFSTTHSKRLDKRKAEPHGMSAGNRR